MKKNNRYNHIYLINTNYESWGGEKMSPKELLYIDDALGHTQFLMNQCRTAANQLTDPVLRQQAQDLVNRNHKLFTQFYDLV